MYTPKHLKKWESVDNYLGEDLSAYYVIIGKSITGHYPSDDALAESNFAIALDRLGGESNTVKVGHFGHYCGPGFDLLLVHESDEKALQEADEIKIELQKYPVLDEDDFSRLEWEKCDEEVESWAYDEACDILGIEDKDRLKPENKSRIKRACIECFQYFGEAFIKESEIWKSLKESRQTL